MPRQIDRSNYNRSERSFRALAITHQNNFAPQLIGKIKQESIYGAITLRFEPDGIALRGIRETHYEQGKFIAAAFLRAGIKELTLKEFPSRPEMQAFQTVIEHAEEGRVEQLGRMMNEGVNFIQQFVAISEGEAIQRGLPGYYNHYTDQNGYLAIIKERALRAQLHTKNGDAEANIYATPLSLTPAEVTDLLYMGSPRYQDRGLFVISFDIVDQELAKKVKKNGLELTLGEDISFDDPRIALRYHGPNPLAAIAA